MNVFSRFGGNVSIMLPILLLYLNSSVATGRLTAVVTTTLGPVQGEILTTVLNSLKYAAFKGIRYAKPPTGYLRFKPPVPADPWKETLIATTEGYHCARMEFHTFVGSEDCLFLNVFTPVTHLAVIPEKLKTVIVYIYGGAWMTGSSRIDTYGPDFLVEKDVVLVTFNYRGGAFGFLNLNHPNATGNAGLKDQNLVLKWVKANIRNFGGNPNNVTLMGASSGGMSVGYHIISDASVGLFHGAISMSSSTLMPWAFQTPETALQRAQKLGTMLGINKTDKESLLEVFYDASPMQIVRTTFAMRLIVSFAPSIENASIATDVFLSKCSVHKYFSGNFTKVPQLLGFMEQETMTFATCTNNNMREYSRLISDTVDVMRYIGKDVSPILRAYTKAFPLIDFDNMSKTDISTFAVTVNETTAILYVVPIDITRRIVTAYNEGKPLFSYHMTLTMKNSPHTVVSNCPLRAAAHTDDVGYLFYSQQANYSLHPPNLVTRNIERISTMWTNLAKYGDPTPHWVESEYPLNVTWPPAGLTGLTLNIGNDLVVESKPINDFVKDIETYFWVYLAKMNACE